MNPPRKTKTTLPKGDKTPKAPKQARKNRVTRICRWCGNGRGIVKLYIIADDLENPKPYHPACIGNSRWM